DQELESQVNFFYKRNFWDKIAGDAIDDQETAFKLYDLAVTSGQPKSIEQIQGVLGLPKTGKITAALIEAINNPAKHLIK
ncbi:glycosyl hydrolase 108 family protein, partial [uncultured Flavobacterium sp.]